MGVDFGKIVKIDSKNLDREIEEHGQKFMDWVERYASAERIMMKAERQLKIAKAEMDAKVRDNPEKYKLEKVTEASVKAKVLLSKKVREAYDYCEQAKYDLEVMRGMREEMGANRKKMIEKLVDLWISGVHSSPKVSKRDGYGDDSRSSKLRRRR